MPSLVLLLIINIVLTLNVPPFALALSDAFLVARALLLPKWLKCDLGARHGGTMGSHNETP